jgi:signal transduction histidine kinase/DNA-binding NarL/FixJ family response regulator
MKQDKHLISLRSLIEGILIAGILSIGIVIYSQWLSARDFQENASVIRLTQMIQQEIAVSRLWFEESLGGDDSIDLEGDVRAPIAAALNLIDAGLGRAGNGVESFNFLPSVHEDLVALRGNIETFDRIIVSRLARRETTGAIGAVEDQMHDAVFSQILLQSQRIAKKLDAHIAAGQSRIFLINIGVLILLVTMFSTVMILVVKNRRALDVRAATLEDLVLERTFRLREGDAEVLERNKDLAAARDQARAASEAKGQFLANMSHEIRTPLNGVIGMTSLLMRSDLSPKQRECVETMHAAELNLLKIINAILDFSTIEAGKITLERSDFSLSGSVDDVLHLFSAEAGKKRLQLKLAIDEDVPSSLHGDPVRLGQILSNLVSNAINYSRDGDIEVACRLADDQPVDTGEVKLRFEVRDCGVGIAKQDQSKLFEKFSQVDDSTTRSGGTGLGLAISKELTNLMGGQIGVESAPGDGSIFWFTVIYGIPAVEVVDERATQRASADETYATYSRGTSEPLLRPKSDKKVLVVDDNEVNLLVTQRMLEQLGFEVDFATNGQAAVEANSRNEYAVILMDSQMPGMDGNDATRNIRRAEGDSSHTPIIALTASAMASDQANALRAGVDDYLCKPVFLEDLEAVLSRLIMGQDQDEVRIVSAPLPCSNEHRSHVFDQRIVEDLRGIGGDGDEDLFSELADQFIELMPGWLSEFRSVVGQGDTELAKRQAHKLLGLCRQIGAQRMAQVCSGLASIEADDQLNSLLCRVDRLHDEFDVVQKELHDKHLRQKSRLHAMSVHSRVG